MRGQCFVLDASLSASDGCALAPRRIALDKHVGHTGQKANINTMIGMFGSGIGGQCHEHGSPYFHLLVSCIEWQYIVAGALSVGVQFAKGCMQARPVPCFCECSKTSSSKCSALHKVQKAITQLLYDIAYSIKTDYGRFWLLDPCCLTCAICCQLLSQLRALSPWSEEKVERRPT